MGRRLFNVLSALTILLLLGGSPLYAQMMGSFSNPDANTISQTQQDEKAGQQIFTNLQNNATTCQQLTDDDFDKLGDYFMGRSIGNSQQHAAMDAMMQSMMGEQAEQQMHIAMGKRLSGCDSTASIPTNGNRFIPMFISQGGGGFPMMGYGWNGMMGGWGGWGLGLLGFLPMILFWVILIIAVIALFRYLGRGSLSREEKHSTALDILKERYAKGDISKKDYEAMKKDIS